MIMGAVPASESILSVRDRGKRLVFQPLQDTGLPRHAILLCHLRDGKAGVVGQNQAVLPSRGPSVRLV